MCRVLHDRRYTGAVLLLPLWEGSEREVDVPRGDQEYPRTLRSAERLLYLPPEKVRWCGARNDLARMLGTRFVTAVEASSHRSFDEAVIKQLTGGDAVVARRLYEEHFEFDPTHKIWLAANHRPSIGEQSEAFWRRIRLIPFTVYIPPAKRDRQLKKKLLAESSGILNWMIDGCRKWKAEGLGEPHKVEEAIESYRDSEDLLGEYFAASCRMSPKEWATTADLYRAFTDWWRDTRGIHLKPPSHRWFNRALGERKNLKSIKQNGIPGWKGIGVKVSFQ